MGNVGGGGGGGGSFVGEVRADDSNGELAIIRAVLLSDDVVVVVAGVVAGVVDGAVEASVMLRDFRAFGVSPIGFNGVVGKEAGVIEPDVSGVGDGPAEEHIGLETATGDEDADRGGGGPDAARAFFVPPADFRARFGTCPEPLWSPCGLRRRAAGFLAAPGVDLGVPAADPRPPGPPGAARSGEGMKAGSANIGGGGAVRMPTQKSRTSSYIQ